MSYGSMPGFGDSATWPAAITPRDPRYVKQDKAARDEAVETISKTLLREYISDPAKIREALMSPTPDECDAIWLAYFAGPEALYRATQSAMLRELKDMAIAQAQKDVDAIDCEDEVEHFASEVAA